jgi:hypothetical protein
MYRTEHPPPPLEERFMVKRTGDASDRTSVSERDVNNAPCTQNGIHGAVGTPRGQKTGEPERKKSINHLIWGFGEGDGGGELLKLQLLCNLIVSWRV